MKVETDLKSGAFAQDVAQQVGQAADQVAIVFSKANKQAADLSNSVVKKSVAVWNALLS